MRHNFAGTSYNDGSTASTTGAPEAPTEYCPDETSDSSGIYLCGYELVADIDFAGPMAYPEGHDDDTDDNIDLNGNADGNFTPIGSITGTSFLLFTARFHGNGHASPIWTSSTAIPPLTTSFALIQSISNFSLMLEWIVE